MPPEVLSHHMASLHSKDNPQGSPALLLIQLLFTPHLLSNIWQNERFVKEFRLPPNQFDNNRISVVFNNPACSPNYMYLQLLIVIIIVFLMPQHDT